jgi:hypothetical protein
MNRRCRAGKWRTYLVWRRRDEDDGNGAMTVQCHLLLFFVHFSFVLSFGLLFFFFFALSYSLCSSFFVFFFLLVFRFSFSVFFFLCVPPPVFSLLVPLCSPFFFRGLSLSVRPGPSFLCLLVLFSPLILSFLLIFSVSSSWSLCVVSPCPLVFSPVFVPSPPSRLCSFRSPPVRGLYAMRSPPDNIFFSSWSGETKKMNSFLWNGAIFQLKWLFSVCPPEVLQFSNWALIHGKSLFFFNFAPGSISIEPLYFGVINKTVLFSNLINSVLNWLFKF